MSNSTKKREFLIECLKEEQAYIKAHLSEIIFKFENEYTLADLLLDLDNLTDSVSSFRSYAEMIKRIDLNKPFE